MKRLGFEPEKILLFSKNTLFPVLLVNMFFIYFFVVSEFSEKTYHTIHSLFIITSALAVLVSAYFRIFSVLMAVSILYISSIVISGERYMYGEDYVFSAGYNIWSIMLLPNLLFAYLIFNKIKKHKYWSLFYVFLFGETAIIEKLHNPNVNADSYYFYKHIGAMNYPAFYISMLCLVILLMCYINKGKMLGASAFFSSLMAFVGLLLSNNLFAFSLFLWGAILVEFLTMLHYLHYIRFKDEELNIADIHAYIAEADKKYPLKYSISLLYLDDYDRLLKRFGYNRIILLKKMFIRRIKEVNPTVDIYNYGKDALVLAFTNANTKESFEKAETIRRALVKSIFVFNENNHLQLTVSQCVSERKRSDAGALAVLERAEESLQKACKFTRNITVKA